MLLLNEYEKEIISILLSSNENFQKMLFELLSEKMFTIPLYRKIFEVCNHLLKSNTTINVFSVSEILTNNSAEILFLQENFISNVNYKFYVDKIQQAYFDRLAKSAESVNDIKFLNQELDNYADTSVLVPITYNADKLLTENYENQKNIMTGYPSIDEKLGSMQGGDFIVFAGATGMGKTCMMVNLITSIAKQGFKADLFSLEMTMPQLQNRLICSQCGVNSSRYRTKSFKNYEIELYDKYVKGGLNDLKINVCTDYRITTDKIRSITKKSDSDIVFIDYLGLIKAKKGTSPYDRVSEVSRELKLIALETNKPFFVLHQLSRKLNERQDKMPKLSDLRDSGNIEQDADVVCFVHRPAYFDPNSYKEWELHFLIGKSRHTESNQDIELLYDAKSQGIRELCSK